MPLLLYNSDAPVGAFARASPVMGTESKRTGPRTDTLRTQTYSWQSNSINKEPNRLSDDRAEPTLHSASEDQDVIYLSFSRCGILSNPLQGFTGQIVRTEQKATKLLVTGVLYEHLVTYISLTS